MASRPTTLHLGRQRLLADLPTISKAYRLVITHLTRADSKIRHTVTSNSIFPHLLLLPHQSLTRMLATITHRTTIRVTTTRDTATRSSLIGELTRITSVHSVWLKSRNLAIRSRRRKHHSASSTPAGIIPTEVVTATPTSTPVPAVTITPRDKTPSPTATSLAVATAEFPEPSTTTTPAISATAVQQSEPTTTTKPTVTPISSIPIALTIATNGSTCGNCCTTCYTDHSGRI